jgi:hypothetical protein
MIKYTKPKKRNFGMKIGGKHNWAYTSNVTSEKRIGNVIKFQESQTKKRNGKQYKTGFPTGGKLKWGIEAVEIVKPIKNGLYKHTMYGTKYQDALALRQIGKLIRTNKQKPKRRKY